MLVMKFGGTSLGDRERIETMVALVKGRLPRRPILVCSAHSKVTDLLLEGARQAAAGRPDVGPIAEREREILAGLKLPASLVEADLQRPRSSSRASRSSASSRRVRSTTSPRSASACA